MAFESGVRLRSGGLILVLSGLTLALGFAVQVALAATLGTGREMDVYLVAVTVPTLLAVMAIAVFPSYLVPVLQARAAVGGTSEAAVLTGTFARRTALAALGLVIALELAAPVVVRLVAPGFAAEEVRQATVLLRVMLVGSTFDILRGVLTAAEYARERFLRPQLAPSANHAIVLASVLLFLKPFGLVGLAAGWAVGSLAMFVIVLPALRGARRSASLHAPVGTTAGPAGGLLAIVAVAALAQLAPVVDRVVASLLPAGAISYLGYGSKLLEVMMRTVPMAAALAAFPALSAHAARSDDTSLGDETVHALRVALLGSAPIAVAVVAFRVPLVQLLFQRGAFDAAATRHVATACAWYAAAFVPASAAYVLTQLCFALRKAWLLAGVGAASLVLTAALDLALARVVGFAGIALAFLVVSLVQLAVLWRYLVVRQRLVAMGGLLFFAGQLAAACTAMGAVWAVTTAAARPWASSHPAIWLGVNAIAGGVTFGGALWCLRISEVRRVVAKLGGRRLGIGRSGGGTEAGENRDALP